MLLLCSNRKWHRGFRHEEPIFECFFRCSPCYYFSIQIHPFTEFSVDIAFIMYTIGSRPNLMFICATYRFRADVLLGSVTNDSGHFRFVFKITNFKLISSMFFILFFKLLSLVKSYANILFSTL